MMPSARLRTVAGRSSIATYGVSVVAVAIAAAINAALWPEFGRRYPLILFYPAIMVAAWFGGFRPGGLATTLATAIGALVWFQSQSSTTISRRSDVLALTLFVGVGLVMSALCESLRRHAEREGSAREEAERAVQEARELAHEVRVSQERLLDVERQARQQAEQANRVKDQFVSTVSHELRTPLNAILGWADLLRHGQVAESRRDRAVHAIYEGARRQMRLIDDLLDVARIMSGKLRLERTRMDLRTVVQGALEVVEPAADANSVRLLADMDPDPDLALFFGDPTRLQQVVWNLLTNAVKFTPRGGTVHTQVQRRDGVVEVVVRDTGRGIDAAFLPHVFQPFRQGDASTTRAHGGLGLGLSIVRHIVEAHGGSVSAESDGEGRGATFMVRLPLLTVRTDLAQNELLPGPSQPRDWSMLDRTALEGICVLVVDDDADSREVTAAGLEQAGAVAVTASSSEAALDILAHQRIDVVIADIAMPSEDGYTFIGKVRRSSQRAIATVPAVAVTSLARPEDRQSILAAGFQAHVPKPVDAHSLVDLVSTLARRTAIQA